MKQHNLRFKLIQKQALQEELVILCFNLLFDDSVQALEAFRQKRMKYIVVEKSIKRIQSYICKKKYHCHDDKN